VRAHGPMSLRRGGFNEPTVRVKIPPSEGVKTSSWSPRASHRARGLVGHGSPALLLYWHGVETFSPLPRALPPVIASAFLSAGATLTHPRPAALHLLLFFQHSDQIPNQISFPALRNCGDFEFERDFGSYHQVSRGSMSSQANASEFRDIACGPPQPLAVALSAARYLAAHVTIALTVAPCACSVPGVHPALLSRLWLVQHALWAHLSNPKI
jgi:hypothetical protein